VTVDVVVEDEDDDSEVDVLLTVDGEVLPVVDVLVSVE